MYGLSVICTTAPLILFNGNSTNFFWQALASSTAPLHTTLLFTYFIQSKTTFKNAVSSCIKLSHFRGLCYEKYGLQFVKKFGKCLRREVRFLTNNYFRIITYWSKLFPMNYPNISSKSCTFPSHIINLSVYRNNDVTFHLPCMEFRKSTTIGPILK